MQNLKIAYVNVCVSDLARSAAFFEKTLGLKLNFTAAEFGYASFDAGPIQMGLARVDPKEAHNRTLLGRHTGVGFAVLDLEAAHSELTARGVTFTMKPEKQPWGGFMALFAEPIRTATSSTSTRSVTSSGTGDPTGCR